MSPGAVRPTTVEQFELLHRQNQLQNQNRVTDPGVNPRLPINQSGAIQRPPLNLPPAVTTATSVSDSNVNEEGIPDNVTAELEKLEQETGIDSIILYQQFCQGTLNTKCLLYF